MAGNLKALIFVLIDYFYFLVFRRGLIKNFKLKEVVGGDRQSKIYAKLEADFKRVEDHWKLDSSPFETERYRVMLQYVRNIPHGSVLEIGCAEGNFTRLLTSISDDITAIDVSPLAVKRARMVLPSVTFVAVPFENFQSDRHYDLIVCSETIYYMVDKETAFKRMKHMGTYLLTSNFLAEKRGSEAELCLGRFRPIFRSLKASIKEQKASMIGLWKLN